ncbi:MAG: rod shape-determining protein MreC [candidate division Zixibacteria bacterium]|nr:rod shape-determining protein MreC [candidate division Zixibacteria bacterium]
MKWTSTILGRNRRFIGFGTAVFLFFLITILSSTVRPFFGNVSSALILYPFAELKGYVAGLQSVADENRRLKNSLVETSLQLSALAEARRENTRLREFLGFDAPEHFRVVPVKIVSLRQQVYPIAAVINKGSSDSLAVDQPVINRFGLVGRVKEVMPHFATVQLLTDPTNAVSGRVAESRQFGIVRFSPARGMYFDNLPADAEIHSGDLIISSGLGGVYPAGLSIAIVDSVYAAKGDILKQVWLKPTVNLYEIEELYVLISDTL